MTAAIPHALLLLHAVMDVLPYPKGPKGMWYEIHTGSTECVDEVESKPSKTGGSGDDANDDSDEELRGIGGVEATPAVRKSRINVSSIRLLVH